MSTSHDTEHHDEMEGAVHVHIHSIRFYGGILAILIALTVITVATSLVDVDGFIQPGTAQGAGGFNLAIAMIIATIKAGFVVTFFMHLRDDSRFNALVFVGSVLFAGVFLAYTMNDTGHRGQGDPFYGVHVLPTTGERAPGGVQCDFMGESPEQGVSGLPLCGENPDYSTFGANIRIPHTLPCIRPEGDQLPTFPTGVDHVCIFENDTVVAVTQAAFTGGQVGGAWPSHEGAHEGGHDSEHEGAHGE
jgi:cytochrome c oxidase subunit 4